ncbi:lycopene cyclase domain-containing protein [Lentzea flava]|uniref:Phytoene synthase n=1 Tax=Lentzea flava TaxID=103732 RepID=A0ABQ2VFQ2_9PSEU|nr:lycopene cyclase domain-containing protein [Lentzea flava]MCP2205041.1 hypothetical protein [Lentzea flava]GGU82978.1 phytoene synthase [Lentzea flava]
MIYREFLAFLLAPLMAVSVALFLLRHRHTDGDLVRQLTPIGLLAVVAVFYTAPWDGWIIRNSVWSYPPGSIWGTIADVPLEEYVFMIGQTVVTGLWTLTTATAAPEWPAAAGGGAGRRTWHAVSWLLAAAVGAVAATVHSGSLYAGSMLAWFGPPLALQAAVGADVLRSARVHRLLALLPTPVFWAADAIAIHADAWRISPDHTSGVVVLGLPVEEVAFFLLTNMLIVNSLILLNTPAIRDRLRPKRSVSI